ncbi:MAG: phosphotransferase [Bdellovibrionaceae bacterium]|nr:phosphotransferase [Pseudobdellovibrionaceae bacterium]
MATIYADIADAKKVVVLWNGKPDSLVHLGDFGNSVFKYETYDNKFQVLRFTDVQQRSLKEVLGELEFLAHLEIRNVSSCRSLATLDGTLASVYESSRGLFTCSSLGFIQGIQVSEESPYWNEGFFREWGRNLGEIHQASQSFCPTEQKRWQWDEEHLIKNAKALIPSDDYESLRIFQGVLFECQNLETKNSNFGVIHADHAPQNFQFDPAIKKITAIDFGNCCYHWYLADVAISLSTVRRKSNRDDIRSWIISGYVEYMDLPDDHERLVDLFVRLRVIYVYLDRLHRFGSAPNSSQAAELLLLRERVHAQKGW